MTLTADELADLLADPRLRSSGEPSQSASLRLAEIAEQFRTLPGTIATDREFYATLRERLVEGLKGEMERQVLLHRDPRLDPQPGDVLREGKSPYGRRYVEVLDKDGSAHLPRRGDPRYVPTDVSFFDARDGREQVCAITQWREQMKDAEVLFVLDARLELAPKEELAR